MEKLIKNHLQTKKKYEQTKEEIIEKINKLEKKLKSHKDKHKKIIECFDEKFLNCDLGKPLSTANPGRREDALQFYGRYDEKCISIRGESNLKDCGGVVFYIHINSDYVKIFKVFYKDGWGNDFLRLELYRVILNKKYEQEVNNVIEEINKINSDTSMTINGIVCKCSKIDNSFYWLDDIEKVMGYNRGLYYTITEMKEDIIMFYNMGIIKTFMLTS